MRRFIFRSWFSSIPGRYATFSFLGGLAVFSGTILLYLSVQTSGFSFGHVAGQTWLLWLAALPFLLAVFGYLAGKHQETLLVAKNELEAVLAQRTAELARSIQGRERENTEYQRLERMINRGKREWEATFDSVSDSILIVDQYRLIIRCNRSTIQRLRTTFEELIGRTIDEVFYGPGQTEQALFPLGAEEIQLPALDGWYEVASSPLLVEGVIQGMVYTIHDITERKLFQFNSPVNCLTPHGVQSTIE